ncbi:DUF4132 domain-containing protein [Nonomuraea sp. NPDC050404]|uniref:DUF4132 domain-containing protein n=1 Tax=Nonomuraea sp. NPDC050404 TaxID=3155783 RepID=UPI0033F72DB8
MNGTSALSPEARRVHHYLTEPDVGYPAPWPDASRLTAVDLGHLLPLAYRTPGVGGPAFSMRVSVEDEVKERQPEFTPESCVALYEALAAGLEKRKWANVCLAAGALLRCPDGAPLAELEGIARVVTEFMAARERFQEPYALLAVAAVAGMEEVPGMPEDEPSSLAAAERELLLSLDAEHRALLAEIAPRSYGSPPELPGVWDRLSGLTVYADFAADALRTAEARLAAIHAGDLPYRADKAFTAAEVPVLGRAVRLALHRDHPWLPALLDNLVTRAAVAPTAAKTAPSQALLYEIARAAERFPTPEAITALRTARATTRHAGIIKQLDRMIKKADLALADRVEVAFRMPDLGFGPGGYLEVPLGQHRAIIAPATTGADGTSSRARSADGADGVGGVGPGVGGGASGAAVVGGATNAGNVDGAANTGGGGGSGEFELSWWQGGKRLKSVPAAVRKEHPEEVKRLRELVKQVRRQTTTLCRALEAGFAGEVSWPYETWRKQVAEHPITSAVAARLIWEIEVAPGDWRTTPESFGTPARLTRLSEAAGAGPADELGGPNEPVAAGTAGRSGGSGASGEWRVRLWHPGRARVEEVARWRGIVTEGRVKQPFKQAFREVYPLTPAEEETATYSNRFAAHVVEYRRLYALFKGRGWQTKMLGPWDGGDEADAERVLAEGRWRASLHHRYLYDAPGEYAATGRVRFHRRGDGGGWEEAALAEVPPLVFGEAMRDVDLFVAVTSIAADPEWADRENGQPFGDWDLGGYWRDHAFGSLQPSGEVRRDAVARILPRLAIADRCTLTDRFLVVRGDLRTYSIHLGSGNILMQPGDVYLCIVSAPGRTERLFLPFEEDDRLALILSKALLLARDTEITDGSILTQIKG